MSPCPFPEPTAPTPLAAAPAPLRAMRTWLGAGLIGVLVAAAFWPTVENSFADDAQLLDSTDWRGLSPQRFGWMLTTFAGGRYQPLAWVSLGLDYVLWGLNPRGFHRTSLLWHAANSVLVYLLALALLRGQSAEVRIPSGGGAGRGAARPPWSACSGAVLAGLIFGLHPLRVELVAWASQRGGLVSAFFALLAVLLWVRGRQTPHWRGWFVAALACYVLSLAAGPLGLTLPIVLVILDWFPLGPSASQPRQKWWPAVAEKLPFFALAGGAALVALAARAHAQPTLGEPALHPTERLAQAAYGLVFYVWRTVWPVDLVPLYELRLPIAWLSLKYLGSAVVVLATSGALAWLLWGHPREPAHGVRRAVVVGAACYTAILLPVLGLVCLGPHEVADRYSYLASIAWVVLAGAGLSQLGAAPGWRRWTAVGLTVVGLAVAGGLAGLTRQQGRVWQDPLTLWTHTYEHASRGPLNWPGGLTAYRLARVFDHQMEPERAVQLYRAAIAARPTLLAAYNDLGAALSLMGRFDDAVAAYRAAVVAAPQSADAHGRLGNALAAVGDYEQAAKYLRAAIGLGPTSAAARHSLGNVLLLGGQPDEAIQQFRAALAIAPRDAELYYDLGRACRRTGRHDEAAQAFRAALDINPAHPLARQALADLTSRPGDG